MTNKAHTATLHRVAKRYEIKIHPDSQYDLECSAFVIEVETSATLSSAVERLTRATRPSYIAVTNKEGLQAAIERTEGTIIGVMDPQGNVLRPAFGHDFQVTSSERSQV